MDTTIGKWGNSLALRIPSSIAKDVHLRQGSPVRVEVVQGRMVVKPQEERVYSLSKLLKRVTKRNRHAEQDWGEPRGGESW